MVKMTKIGSLLSYDLIDGNSKKKYLCSSMLKIFSCVSKIFFINQYLYTFSGRQIFKWFVIFNKASIAYKVT